MINSLSVQTILTHSASTRLPESWTQKEKRGFVWEIMDVLGLSHVANSIIGDTLHRGVSGGEKKRVNIGIELVTLPKALFLDEVIVIRVRLTVSLLLDWTAAVPRM